MVTLNGVPLFKGIKSKVEAHATAERWQGERYKRGLLKHADKGDHVEVKHDKATEKDFDERYQVYKDGSRQRVIHTQYVED